MRIRTGHGPDDWTKSIPTEPLSARGWHFGSLAVPASRPAKGAGLTPSQRTPDKVSRPVTEERRRQVAEAQSRLRARKRDAA